MGGARKLKNSERGRGERVGSVQSLNSLIRVSSRPRRKHGFLVRFLLKIECCPLCTDLA